MSVLVYDWLHQQGSENIEKTVYCIHPCGDFSHSSHFGQVPGTLLVFCSQVVRKNYTKHHAHVLSKRARTFYCEVAKLTPWDEAETKLDSE